jgi:uncharacterized membrane protein
MKLRQNFVQLAMITALTVALSSLFFIPIPGTKGFITLCDMGIYTASFLFGPIGGFLVGGLSGGLLDLISGYPQWAPFSFIIHGGQGLIAGFLYFKIKNNGFKVSASLFLGTVFMVVGYTLATALLFTWPAAIASIPVNICQNLLGIVVTIPLVARLKKMNIKSLNHLHSHGK